MKKTCTFLAVLLLSFMIYSSAGATGLLTEDFSYTAGTLLTATGNWTAHSGTGTNAITVSTIGGATGLSYSGYVNSNVGLSVNLASTTGEDDNRLFTGAATVTSGNVYMAAMINVTAAQTGDYFLHLGSGTSAFQARLFVKTSGTGYVFGIGKSSEPAVYETTVRDLNTTYLVVLKYIFNAGATNDEVDLFVNPTLGSEPSPILTEVGTAADATTLAAVFLRQGSSTAMPNVTIDGINVGTTWGDVIPNTTPTLAAVPTSITGLTYITGAGPSVGQSYSLSGSSLSPASGNITVTAPLNFEVCATLGGTYTPSINVPYSSSTLSATNVFVRLKSGLAINTYGPSNVTNAGGGATTLNVPVSGSVEVATQLFVSVPSITGLDYSVGHGPSAAGTYNLSGSSLSPNGSITITAPANFEVSLSLATGYGLSVIKTYTGTSLSSTPIFVRLVVNLPAASYGPLNVTNAGGGATTENVAVSGTVSTPVVTLSTATLNAFSYVLGSGPSFEQTYTITGSSLFPASGNISVTAPTDYEVSTTTGTGFSGSVSIPYTAGTLATTTIYVHLKAGLAIGTYNSENIAVSGGGSSSQNVTCNGYVGPAPYFTDDFAYTVGTALVGQGGWAQTGTVVTNPITITAGGLNAVGDAITLTTGQDANHQFAGVTSGVMYASALVNVSATTTSGDYFIHFGDAGSFAFYGRTYVKTSGGGFVFGFGKTNEAAVYGTTVYTLGVTYRIVLKYNFVAGATNDFLNLYVDVPEGGPEPAPDFTSPSTGSDIVDVSGINLRQGGANAPTLRLDGIKVGQTWAQVNPSVSLTLTALVEALFVAGGGTAMTTSPQITVELHNATTPYALVESTSGTLSTAGVGTFNYSNAVSGTPYFIVVKSVNTLEVWSAAAHSFTSGLFSYDFTTAASQAFGTNALALHSGKYCIYSGDLNQSGLITSADYTGVDNDNNNFAYHYVNDLNGNGIVTSADYTFIDNNNTLFIGKQIPPGAAGAVFNPGKPIKLLKKSNVN